MQLPPLPTIKSVKGVVQNWRLAKLLPLVQAVKATGIYGFERAIFLLPLVLRATGWRGKFVSADSLDFMKNFGWHNIATAHRSVYELYSLPTV